MAGVTIWVTDKCIGCGTCIDACFVNAIKLKNNRAEISKECRGCGRCVEICTQGAIELKIDDKTYVSQTIEQLEKIIDVS